MKKNTKFLCLLILAFIPVACTICPGQLFVASGVNGNGCCGAKTVVVVNEEGAGQKVSVNVSSSPAASASPTGSPSASASPSASPSESGTPKPSPTASGSPVPSATPSPVPTASPTTAIAAQ